MTQFNTIRSYLENVPEAVTAVTAEIDNADALILQLDAEADAAAARAEQAAELLIDERKLSAQLQEALRLCREGHPNPTPVRADMWVGATIDKRSGETDATAVRNWEAKRGRCGVLRTFNPRLPATFALSNKSAQMKGRHRIISVKGDATPAYWDRYIASIPVEVTPTGEDVITALGIHHEPENDGVAMTPARYKAACKLIDEAILRSGRKDLIAAVILMTWLEDDNDNGTSSSDYFPENAHRFVLLLDPYDPKNVRTGRSKAELTLALWRQAGGVFWGIAETGTHRTGAALVAWIRDFITWCASEGALFFCWFHSGVGNAAGTQGWWLDDAQGCAEYARHAPVVRAAA